MKLLVLVITDGRRDCILQTIASLRRALDVVPERMVIVDDSGDPDYRTFLETYFPDFDLRAHPSRLGHGSTMIDAWRTVAELDPELVFHVEDDFVFPVPLELEAMAKILDLRPNLCQIALRRQAWFPSELRAGGIIERNPDAYTEHRDGDLVWLEHREGFTTNPTLYRRALVDVGWPDGARSERNFGRKILADPKTRSGYFGGRDEDPRVIHIGETRVGNGY